jgi:hypothetical protein
LLFDFAASFAPNLSVSADSTAFFSSSGFAQRSSGVLLSAVMVVPMLVHPATAGELTYSETALASTSGVMLNPVEIAHMREVTRVGGCYARAQWVSVGLTNTTFGVELSVVHGKVV